MILVDSSVWVESLRKQGLHQVKELLSRLLENNSVLTCGPIKLEILGSARKSERKILDEYFREITSLDIDNSIWHNAVLVSRALRDRGASIPWNDILIGATAKHYGVPIYTIDKHFLMIKKVAGIKLLYSVPGKAR